VRGTAAVVGDCIFAEPVPVRRPGVFLTVDVVVCTGTVFEIGKTKIGLNLENI
jgi:hypothetical protein